MCTIKYHSILSLRYSLLRTRQKWNRASRIRNKGRYSSFLSNPTPSSIIEQITLSPSELTNNSTSTEMAEEMTTEKLLIVQMDKSNVTMPVESSTDSNLDLIRRKMMLMQIDMSQRYGPNGIRYGGFDNGALPLMSGKSSRPNVFETREERRRRLIDEER